MPVLSKMARYNQKPMHGGPQLKSPTGAALTGPLGWGKSEMHPEMYVHSLTTEEIEELEVALKKFRESDKHFGYISQDNFPLPTLGPVLRQRSRELHNVNGLLLVRGLDPKNYEAEEYIAIYAGIFSWIASKRGVQDANLSENKVVALHVTDHDIEKIRAEDPDRFVASANTNVAMPFHSDFGDIIGLAYRQLSLIGGEVLIASGWKVYNELLGRYPKVLETLSKPFPWHLAGNSPDRLFHELVLETLGIDGARQITTMLERRPFFGDSKCPRPDSLPCLTGAQKKALDVVESIARENYISVSLQVGDLFFINNRAMLHARSAFQDVSEDPSLRRHAIRMVARDAEYGWPIPEALKHRYTAMFGRTEDPEEEQWPINPFVWGPGAQHG